MLLAATDPSRYAPGFVIDVWSATVLSGTFGCDRSTEDLRNLVVGTAIVASHQAAQRESPVLRREQAADHEAVTGQAQPVAVGAERVRHCWYDAELTLSAGECRRRAGALSICRDAMRNGNWALMMAITSARRAFRQVCIAQDLAPLARLKHELRT